MAFAKELNISHTVFNRRLLKAEEKLGFKIVGRLDNYREWIDGKMCASIMRKMTKNEWFFHK